MHAIATGVALSTVIDCIHPADESGWVRFTPEEVKIMLPHEVFSSVERIQVIAIRRCRERSFGVHTQQAETAIGRTESIVHACRRDGVEAVGLDIKEIIIAVAVANRLTRLSTVE